MNMRQINLFNKYFCEKILLNLQLTYYYDYNDIDSVICVINSGCINMIEVKSALKNPY